MSPTRDRNTCAQSAQVAAYVMQVLQPDDRAAFDAHVASCAQCRQELETFQPIADTFAFWPTNVLRPPASLQERLASRIAAETGEALVPPPGKTVGRTGVG